MTHKSLSIIKIQNLFLENDKWISNIINIGKIISYHTLFKASERLIRLWQNMIKLHDRQNFHLHEVTAVAVTLGGFNPDKKGVHRLWMMDSTPVTATKMRTWFRSDPKWALALIPNSSRFCGKNTPTKN